MPGAGSLKGTKFLIFLDWQAISSHPEWDQSQRLAKCWDLFIKTATLYRNTPDWCKKYESDLHILKDRLDELQKKCLNFGTIEGSNDIGNQFMGETNDLLYDIYDLEYKEKLIETADHMDLDVPE
jgi:hypothetical protein